MKTIHKFITIILLNSLLVGFSMDKIFEKSERKLRLQKKQSEKITTKNKNIVSIKNNPSKKTKEIVKNKKEKAPLVGLKMQKLSSINSDINELDSDLQKIKDETQRKEKEKIEQELAVKKQMEEEQKQEQERALKLKLEAKKPKKKHTTKKNKKNNVRKLLLKKFHQLDSPDQINKLNSIYKSYGIKIKDLSVPDLKFLIKNTKKLLDMYYDPSSASGRIIRSSKSTQR